MFGLLIVFMIIFVGVVFYLVRTFVLQIEQNSEVDVLKAKQSLQNIIEQKDKAHTEKSRLEKEATQMYTLFEITKNIGSHISEQEAFEQFKNKLRDNISFDDCQLIVDLGNQQQDKIVPQGYDVMLLKSKEESLGCLIYKGVKAKDLDKLTILANQFALSLRRIKLHRDIERLAITDGLTGVFTRRYFMERFEEEIQRALSKKIKLAFMMVDVDHFKMVNDQYGHLTGDYVLKEISQIIRENIREIDIVGRYGGEEFCMVLPETDLDGAFLVAERIRKAAQERLIKAYDASISITLSLGISIYPSNGKDTEELIDKADWSLYRAKSQGRNRTIAFGQYN